MAHKNDKTGGYNVDFVNPLDSRYKCVICSLALRSPFQAECGHRFCEECIKQTITSGPKICPIDKSPLSLEQIFKDAFCNRDILDMECFCTNKALGCQWTGQLRKMEEEHYDECEFLELDLDCPNDQCPYCGQNKLMEKQHNEECPKIKLPCPKGCPATVERAKMKHHVQQTCPNAKFSCPLEGCEYRSSRIELSKHLQDKSVDHAFMIKNQTVSFQSRFDQLQTEVTSLAQRIQQLEQQIPAGGEDWRRYTSVQETQSDVQMADHDVEISMLETTSYDGTYIWKIDEVGRRIHEALTWQTLSIYSPPFYVGRFGYKVCARVSLNGDGMGKGTHLSLFFVVMRGAYDALLPWPFQQKVSFKLIDQSGDQHIIDSFRPDPNSSSFQRPTSNMNIASGCPLFAPKLFLHRGYIKDDTVFLKISVDNTGIPNF